MMSHMTINIETASIRHLDVLCEIEKQCFTAEAFTRQQIANLLTDYDSITLIAKESSQVVGFIIGTVCCERSALTGHILTLDILPAYRRKGAGAKLLRQMEVLFRNKGVKGFRLEVREDNFAAINLYRRFGYKIIGKLKNYYGTTHGLYLRKDLT